MTKFSYVSLFSGIGGFEQALNRIGGKCVLASEIDRFANQAYEALYGEPTAGDITEIDAKDVPDHDLLVGGFPCQAFSVAGQRKGFEDTRGTLFFEIARIAVEKRPKALLLENVKGLVNHGKGETLRIMLETLGDIGYRVDFDVLNSKFYGVPQNRERIFIVAVREDLVENTPWIIPQGNTIVPKAKQRHSLNEQIKTFNFDFPTKDTVTTRLRDVLETQVDEKYYLSDEKTVVLVAQLEGLENDDNPTLIDLSQSKREGKPRLYQDVASTVTARIYKEPYMIGHVDIKGHDAIKRVYSAEHVGPTLTTMGGGHREPKTAVKDGQRYRIRKLTPLECWRLQGFSDEAHQTVVDAGLSDSQRYKQAGNAVTVNVISAISERLIPILSGRLTKGVDAV